VQVPEGPNMKKGIGNAEIVQNKSK